MPWINLTLRRGALPKPVQHAMMAMWWEKVPDTPTARRIMKGWKVADDADYNAGSPDMTSRSTFSKSVFRSTGSICWRNRG